MLSSLKRKVKNLTQGRRKPNPVDQPVRTAHTIIMVHNTVDIRFPPELQHISDVAT